MYFKEKIVQLRKDESMTQEFFAKAVGVSRQAVYKWEKGISYPEAEKLILIARLFGVSIDSLLEEDADLFDLRLEGPNTAKKKAKKKAPAKTARIEKKEDTAPSTEETEIAAAKVNTEELFTEDPAEKVKEISIEREDNKDSAPVRTAAQRSVSVPSKKPPKKQSGLFDGLRGIFGRRK